MSSELQAPKNHGIGANVDVIGLTKTFGSVVAVDEVSFSIQPGEFISLLGPSGSGKTTILMNIAGFQAPTNGEVLVAGVDVLPLPAHKRNIGMVFQKYALFPHMTAAGNVAFPLQMRGWSKSKIEAAVAKTLDIVQLKHLGSRRPSQLSGGQQQRIALARAIVFEPPLLLMDEPLGALDKKLREELQFEIKALQHRLGITVLFVTHDQDEALAMSDRIAVMNHGRIEQIGKPQDLYQTPQSIFVADFMGDSNFFEGAVASVEPSEGIARITIGDQTTEARADFTSNPNLAEGESATIMVRPECLKLARANSPADGHQLSGKIESIQFGGSKSKVAIACQDKTVFAVLPVLPGASSNDFSTGDNVSLSWVGSDAIAFQKPRGGLGRWAVVT